ncbi:MAG TPA: hypothetical protein VMB52_07130 [Verrucomicrobiae bacterium]|nr:hypothetical protein [Verrucomicrobiae bacterium]
MKRLVVLVTALLWLLLPASTAFAYNPLSGACGSGTNNSSVCGVSGNDPITGNTGVLFKTTEVIATVGGVTAIIVIIVEGINIVSSNGDAQKVTKARQAIIGALIGLVLIATAESIIVFVVGKI